MNDDSKVAITELLEAYIVATVGELDGTREQATRERAATLWQGDDWRRALRDHLDLPDDFDSALVEAFEHHRVSADDAGFPLDADDFARAFVMHNFVTSDDGAEHS